MARPIFNAGMFGVPTGLDMTGLKTPEMTPTIAAAASPRRRRGLSGMLGGVVNLANGVIDQDRQPNFLDFLLGGQNRVDAMRAAPYEQDALQFRRDQQAHQRQAWAEGDATQQRLREWAATQGPDAQVDPASAYEAWRAANAPLTRDQQADNDYRQAVLQETIRHNRAGEGLDWARASGAARGMPTLSMADNQTLNRVSDAADQANSFNTEITRFIGLNARQPTGPGTEYNPGSWFGDSRSRRDEMEGITSRLISSVRAMSGEGGIMTDADAQRFERGLPSVHRSGLTNQNITGASREVARNAQDRVLFYEDWAMNHNGSLLRARSAWNSYLQANPIYGADGNLVENRPGLEEFARGARGGRRQAGNITRAQPTRAELEAERDRRLRARGVTAPYNNQPGGYSGR